MQVATAHSSGQPKPQGSIAPHFASGDIQGLAQPWATAASVKHSGGLPNSNLSYAPLPSSGGDRERAKNETKHYEWHPHKTRSTPEKNRLYKRKQCSSSLSDFSGASEDEQVMTTRVSDIHLRDFNPRGREEWLTRVIMRNKLISYLA